MGITTSLPNNLTNGTQADAGQVMANFNALVSALTKAIDGTDGDTVTGLINFTGGLKRDGNQVLEALSGGYREQNGVSSNNAITANAEYSVTVTFPTAFPAGVTPVIELTPNATNTTGGYKNTTVGANSISNTGFNLIINSPTSQTLSVGWRAIG